MAFRDRRDAGRRLAEALRRFAGADIVVLGLPRGGVPVAFEVAQALAAPLDVLVVRKLGVPFQPELAMGAIGEGVRVLNDAVLRSADVREPELEAVERRERAELERRAQRYRAGRPPLELAGRTVIVVDDGIATGSTARAACQVVRAKGAARVVLAVPVAPSSSLASLAGEADEVVCLEQPAWFSAVGAYYRDFTQATDEEVVGLLEQAGRLAGVPGSAGADPPVRDEEVEVLAGETRLAGHLTIPEHVVGTVVFAHGSGSSRHSPRNRYVASVLNRSGLGTLVFDLLSGREELRRSYVFDVELLGRRLGVVTAWLRVQPGIALGPVGYFGASTGAAAALWAAAEPEAQVAAVVSRGGRPDLAGSRLALVRAPTLLVVGGRDAPTLECNRAAQASLRGESELVVVPGAGHLFEEPGALEEVARLATSWFLVHFAAPARVS